MLRDVTQCECREWEYEEAVARLLGPAEDTQQLAEEEESNVPSFAPRSGLGALANSSLWATYLPDGAPCAADEFTHMFHTVQLWEIPLSPGQDPSLKTWRCAHENLLSAFNLSV